MLTDQQFSRLKSMLTQGKTQQQVADRLEVSRSTVSKYDGRTAPPSETKPQRNYETREGPFSNVWDEVCKLLESISGLQVKAIFEHLQRKYPGKFQDGQKRTLERKIRLWRLMHGPEKEVFFPQEHHPGELGASDYTKMNKLGITIQGQPFEHMLYHFVLTYSNWETVSICYSETFESLSEGLQNALWELGGVPMKHRSDNLGAAVINMGKNKGEMTQRYNGLLDHYGIERSKIQPRKPNENGDVERSNGILKTAVDQRLMLRGSRDFDSIEEYEAFLRMLLKELNAGRSDRLKEEIKKLSSLPSKHLDACTPFDVSVSRFSTTSIGGCVYSVSSRLTNLKAKAKLYSNHIEIWSGGTKIEIIPRAIGKKVSINYRHIIHSLIRKPGAFENYKYREELFPTSHFREGYDDLQQHYPLKAVKEYLHILHLAATYSETEVDLALQELLDGGERVSHYAVAEMITRPHRSQRTDVHVDAVDLRMYDRLLEMETNHGS